MKTKFDALLLGIKHKMQTCEAEIAQIAKEISIQEEEKTMLLTQMVNLQIPQCGNSLFFREVYESKKTYLAMIDDKQSLISELKAKNLQKKEEYRQYHLEFEKINYLRQKEIEEMIRKLKQKEQKELDEVAVMRFYQDNKEKN